MPLVSRVLNVGVVVFGSVKGLLRIADGGLLMEPVALAIDDQLVSRGLDSVNGRLGQHGVGHHAEPLDWGFGRGFEL